MRNMDFGLRGHDVGYNFEEMLKNAAESGIHKLQLALAKTLKNIDFYEVGYNRELALRIKSELQRNNLDVSVLGCYINPVEEDEATLEKDLTLFENFISYAKDLNATVIGTETGSNGSLEKTRSEENYQFFMRNLKRLVKRAEEQAVTIGIEPVYWYTVYSPYIMARVLEDIKSDNLAVIFDLSNLITVENYKEQHKIIDQAFMLFGEKIQVIHLKDFDIKNGEKCFVTAGTGLYDIEYLFKKLERLPKMPDIILDETQLEKYGDSIQNVINRLNLEH